MSGCTAPEWSGEKTIPESLRPLLATHSGTFHLHDAFAVLRLALGLKEASRDHALVRTRDEAVVAAVDVVWDVGAVYDPATGRFDHHQRCAPVRNDGLPYSAAGLVWRHHGEAAARMLLAPEAADPAAAVAAEDAAFVRAADFTEGLLRRRVEAVRARLAVEAVVLAAHARSADPRVLELGRKVPLCGRPGFDNRLLSRAASSPGMTQDESLHAPWP